MTTPNQAKSSRGGIRTYAWPPQPPHEFEHVSVTSALKSLPKPYLVGWAAKVAGECAVEDHDIIAAMLAKGDKRAAIDHIKGARFRDMGKKADRGTIVHAALENYLAGRPSDVATIDAQLEEAHVPKNMWGSAHRMIAGLMEFLFDEEPEVIWSEATVYSRKHHYAGTADLIARMRVGDTVVPVVLDVKTSKAIYDEVGLQLTAYARADFVGLDDGKEMPLLPDGGEIRHGVVVRPTPSGSYQKANFDLTDEVYAKFLACLELVDVENVMAKSRRP